MALYENQVALKKPSQVTKNLSFRAIAWESEEDQH